MFREKPQPPKRPLSAFFLYKADQWERVKVENPDLKVTALTKIISEGWNNLDAHQKAIYEQRNREAKEVYEREVRAYEAAYRRPESEGSDDDDEEGSGAKFTVTGGLFANGTNQNKPSGLFGGESTQQTNLFSRGSGGNMSHPQGDGLFGKPANTGTTSTFGSFGSPGSQSGVLGTAFGSGSTGGMLGSAKVMKAPVVKIKAQGMLERLYASKKFADVTFEVQGEKILAHKYVLSDRSKHFAEVFSADESAQPNMKTITITDINPNTFHAMLVYLYCEEVKSDEDSIIELLRVAEKYTIPDLKAKCEETLGSLISSKNFCKITKAIEEFNTVQLKESLLSFVAKNGMGAIDKADMDEIPKTILIDIVQRLSLNLSRPRNEKAF